MGKKIGEAEAPPEWLRHVTRYEMKSLLFERGFVWHGGVLPVLSASL